MSERTGQDLQLRLDGLVHTGPERVAQMVDLILAEGVRRSASDVHIEPTPDALDVRFRMDGVLQSIAALKRDMAPNVVARLKVMAELLTYRLDIPQEGSIRQKMYPNAADMRVSTFPTIHGEKVVVRIFEASSQSLELEQLGLPTDVLQTLLELMRERTGAIFLTGPSGSGKTTTIYACLRHLVRTGHGGRHIVTIEDPVEQVIAGISQSQARPGSEFDFARGLRSLLRQDPEVIMIGEVRDRDTAGIAIEAALTGHLVFSTLHSGSACGVVGRLLDMGIEPYLLTSGLKGIVNQRLVRQQCAACQRWTRATETAKFFPEKCESCASTGYRGRVLLAELLKPDATLRQAILQRSDTTALEAAASQSGRKTIWDAADQAVAGAYTTLQEIERVLGPRPDSASS